MSHSSNPEYTNNLIHASSPYLLQHAHNPVNWEEWNTEVWEKARTENKLVLVSIGYSACHWCHVMERECFENLQSAEMMNNWFINIKVDREERPDVDMVYMDACQLMTGKGGWPLNVFCLPDGRPIYAGTYFPNESWQQALLQLQSLWANDKAKAEEYAAKVQAGMQQMSLVETLNSPSITKAELPELYETMSQNFDWNDGGPNRAPKFPLPNNYEFLLDHFQITGNQECSDFLHLTLLKMANGGIYDQLRGGFCRYSTDPYWFAPHFEKMLYDNAQLISLYSRAFGAFDAPLYKEIADECIAFCNDELREDSEAFCSALDADSDGIEGRYYVFTWNELQQVLGEEELEFAKIAFSCSENGNWEHGYNILHKKLAPLQVLEQLNIDAASYHALLRSVKLKLKNLQQHRNRPGLDYKMVTSWNALMLKALTDAGMYLGNQAYTEQAEKLADWLWNHQWDGQNLYRIYSKNKTSIPAFLEDYSMLAHAMLCLFSATGKDQYADKALLLAESSIRQFRDPESGVFYFAPVNGENLVVRKTDLADDVMNSSASVMADVLLQLSVIYTRPVMMEMAGQLLSGVRQQLRKFPAWYSNWARIEQASATGYLQIECVGPQAETAAMAIRRRIPSAALVIWTEGGSSLPVFGHKEVENKLNIYICMGQTCLEPVNTAEQAIDLLLDLTGYE